MEELFIIGLLGALVAIDTTVAGQFMVSQPIVSSALAGYLLGDLQAGIYIGIIMQLMWLKLIPAGGSVFLNGNLGTLIAVSVLLRSSEGFVYSIEGLQFTCIVFGIITSYIFGNFTMIQRHINLLLVKRAQNAGKVGNLTRFQGFHMSGVLVTAASGVFLSISFTLIGKWLIMLIPSSYYLSLAEFFPFGIYAFLGIGIGTVFSMAWSKKSWAFPVLGVLAGFAGILLI